MKMLYCNELGAEEITAVAKLRPEQKFSIDIYKFALQPGVHTEFHLVSYLKAFLVTLCRSLLPSDGNEYKTMLSVRSAERFFALIPKIFANVPHEHRETLIFLLEFLSEYIQILNKKLNAAIAPLTFEMVAKGMITSFVFREQINFPLQFVAFLIQYINDPTCNLKTELQKATSGKWRDMNTYFLTIMPRRMYMESGLGESKKCMNPYELKIIPKW